LQDTRRWKWFNRMADGSGLIDKNENCGTG
jgi:hypothetical protein